MPPTSPLSSTHFAPLILAHSLSAVDSGILTLQKAYRFILESEDPFEDMTVASETARLARLSLEFLKSYKERHSISKLARA